MDEDDIVKFEKALLAYWQMSEYDLIVPFGIMSFQTAPTLRKQGGGEA
jgi:hypothetical protein